MWKLTVGCGKPWASAKGNTTFMQDELVKFEIQDF